MKELDCMTGDIIGRGTFEACSKTKEEVQEEIRRVNAMATDFLNELANYRPMHCEFKEDVKRLARTVVSLPDETNRSLRQRIVSLEAALSQGARLGPLMGSMLIPNEEYNKLQAELASVRLEAGYVMNPDGPAAGRWTKTKIPEKLKTDQQRYKEVLSSASTGSLLAELTHRGAGELIPEHLGKKVKKVSGSRRSRKV